MRRDCTRGSCKKGKHATSLLSRQYSHLLAALIPSRFEGRAGCKTREGVGCSREQQGAGCREREGAGCSRKQQGAGCRERERG
eukprot:1188893-Prorocentrum_minimum.AAC.3